MQFNIALNIEADFIYINHVLSQTLGRYLPTQLITRKGVDIITVDPFEKHV
ncbi:hypothetical protein [Cellulosilyticum sp. I15G10I2]|uniref:hypothetical protein n=1 Tax=Cellulosilyticum sp. I15G10I2 TaxID=1892843 RepID=UPI001A9A4046|nr:hypothetical protein [Cellulosilyticum sp. I15G10I2]